MTSKELLRRLNYYSSLDKAAYYFFDSTVDYVYHVSYVYDNNVKSDDFTLSYLVEIPDNLVYLSVERFTRAQFNVQKGYFLAFYNRASKIQQKYIADSLLVGNLLGSDI